MPPRFLSPVPPSELDLIQKYLETHSLGRNVYRKKVGDGVSQCFGIVSKRSMRPDLSRQSWRHPLLHFLLIEFSKKYVPVFFSSIQVNVNFPCNPHKDVGNVGESYIVGFGGYIGGSLVIENQDYDINYRGLLFDGSKLEHWTRPWNGTRYSLVFHTLAPKPRWGNAVMSLENYEVVDDNGVLKIKRLSDGLLLDKDHPLPHPLQRRAVT